MLNNHTYINTCIHIYLICAHVSFDIDSMYVHFNLQCIRIDIITYEIHV